jgi:hypothetical protein
VLSVCREKDAAYEWGGRVERRARPACARRSTRCAAEATRAKLEPDERDIITYTRQLRAPEQGGATAVRCAGQHRGVRWLVELTATIGQYQYIAAIKQRLRHGAAADGEQLPAR